MNLSLNNTIFQKDDDVIYPTWKLLNPTGSSSAVGEDASELEVNFNEAVSEYLIPYSTQEKDLLHKFCNLVVTWEDETMMVSSVSELITHSAYLQIIGMGGEVVPFLLFELQRKPNHWFIALQSITGENPIPESHYGNVPLMIKDWLKWGKQNKLI